MAVCLRHVRSRADANRYSPATVDSYGLPVDASIVCVDAWRSRLRPLGVNHDRGADPRSDRALVASIGVGHGFEIRVEQDARRD
jgi:hypothetical protein